ncbi:hypothetical protein CPB84DRAFT_1818090 [Gymnopilus junonius]|uniref:CxC5 like cysteine cluster associated with KDZ domain-containing protein n=1 Tax=Gymnopilus junonius TaxID=109634 RepID=A0A9P5TF03_GYMJU|nr:hypothetical protein CPB84DRAFT_1818090 [Gymnopilus junonius]
MPQDHKELLLSFLGIDSTTPYLPFNIHNAFIKHCAIMEATLTVVKLHHDEEWQALVGDEDQFWYPKLTNFIDIFIANTQYYGNWKKPFSVAMTYPDMHDWLEKLEDRKSDSDVWGFSSPLKAWVKVKNREKEEREAKSGGSSKRQASPEKKSKSKSKWQVSPMKAKSKSKKKKQESSSSSADTKISLATVLMLLFSITDNPDAGENKVVVSGWLIALTNAISKKLGDDCTSTLLFHHERQQTPSSSSWVKLIAQKLDTFVTALSFSPYDSSGNYTHKLLPVSSKKIQPALVICPRSFVCGTLACQPWSLQQSTQDHDIPRTCSVLTGKCTACNTLYSTDHERYPDLSHQHQLSNNCLKIGQALWVDHLFSSSAESICTIAAESSIDLELDDGLNIKEVTAEAFEVLGEKGVIRASDKHSCSECTQIFKPSDGMATDKKYVKMVVLDGIVMGQLFSHCAYDNCYNDLSNSRSGSLCDQHHLLLASQCLHQPEWNTFRKYSRHNVHSGICWSLQRPAESYAWQPRSRGPNPQCHDDPASDPPLPPNYFSPGRYYCVKTICAPCGVVIAWTKFGHSESTTNILNFLASSPIELEIYGSLHPVHCGLLSLYQPSSSDYLCWTYCNPAPANNVAPNLVLWNMIQMDNHMVTGPSILKSEQLNAWLGGYQSIAKWMTPGNFNWFIMLCCFIILNTHQEAAEETVKPGDGR